MALISNPPTTIDTPLAFTCTPSSLLASVPCLQCISQHDMIAALVGIFADSLAAYKNDVPKLMQDSACFTCMSEKEMLQAFVTIMGNALLGEGTSTGEIIQNYRCLTCASDKQLLAALLYMFCVGITVNA